MTAPTVENTDIFRRAVNVSFTSLGDEVLVLDTRQRRSHRLPDTAAFIWLQCNGRTSVADIITHLTDEYDVTEDTARADVLEILERYLAAGIIEHAG